MKRIKLMIIFLLLMSIILIGCNTNKNQYGINEKETDKYVELVKNTHQSGESQNYRYFNVKFLNSNISFDIYTEAGEFISVGSSVIYNDFVICYNNKDTETLCWVGHILSRFYIDIIIMEKDNIIGYALIKIENNFGGYLLSIEKQVVFPDAINNKIKLSKDIVKILLSENKQYITDLDKIVEEETNEFISKENVRNEFFVYIDEEYSSVLNLFSLNFKDDSFVYEMKTSSGAFTQVGSSKITNVIIDSSKFYSRDKLNISMVWDEFDKVEKEDILEIPTTYMEIIVYENNIIKGYIVLKIEKKEISDDKGWGIIIYSTSIIKQVKFPQKSKYQDDNSYITRKQVKQLIEKCKE